MNTPDILEKLERLEQEFSGPSVFDPVGAQNTIREWGKTIRKNLAIKDLKNNLGMKQLMTEMVRKEKACTVALSEDKTLDDKPEEKKAIRRERECWRWFINIFDGVDSSLSNIEKQIDSGLSN